MVHLTYLSLICILAVAAVMDISTFRVKNRWIIFGLVFEVILYIAAGQWAVIANKAAGFLLPASLLVLYRYSMLGAADIKLFAVAGFYLGFRDSFLFIVMTFMLASGLAVYRILTNHCLKKRFFYFLNFIRDFSTNEKHIYMDFANKDKTACLHMTVPMAVTAVLLYARTFLV